MRIKEGKICWGNVGRSGGKEIEKRFSYEEGCGDGCGVEGFVGMKWVCDFGIGECEGGSVFGGRFCVCGKVVLGRNLINK